MSDFFVDIHCHPQLKPYSRSFKWTKQGVKQLQPSTKRSQKHSVWFANTPNQAEIMLNHLTSLTKFTQADFRTLCTSGVKVICAAMGPVEKAMADNKMSRRPAGNLLLNFISGFGKGRIEYLKDFQKSSRYFEDLEDEYAWLKRHSGEIKLINGKECYYNLVSNYSEVEKIVDDTEGLGLAVVPTIEGGHSFGCGIDTQNNPASEAELIGNIRKVKAWKHRPFFITLSHFIYNELAGHAKSMMPPLYGWVGQANGQDTGITQLGYKTVEELLEGALPIYIDIKHLSLTSRKQYYHLLKENYSKKGIPIIVSHGAVTGFENKIKGEQVLSNVKGAEALFNDGDINFYDFELIEVAKSGGIFGLQLDKRRCASRKVLRKARHRLNYHNRCFYWSLLIWNQIEHIAKVLDAAGQNAWDIQCIGSDFDGLVDPPNTFYTTENFPHLSHYLLLHATDFMEKSAAKFLKKRNGQMAPEKIIRKVMQENAMSFLKKYFQRGN